LISLEIQKYLTQLVFPVITKLRHSKGNFSLGHYYYVKPPTFNFFNRTNSFKWSELVKGCHLLHWTCIPLNHWVHYHLHKPFSHLSKKNCKSFNRRILVCSPNGLHSMHYSLHEMGFANHRVPPIVQKRIKFLPRTTQ